MKKKFIYWLWGVAEIKDWNGTFPRPFWRWLLRKTDAYHGHQYDSLGQIILKARPDLNVGCDSGQS